MLGGLVGILYAIAVILAVIWIISWLVFHVTVWAIHLLIVAAVVIVLWNLFMGARQRA